MLETNMRHLDSFVEFMAHLKISLMEGAIFTALKTMKSVSMRRDAFWKNYDFK